MRSRQQNFYSQWTMSDKEAIMYDDDAATPYDNLDFTDDAVECDAEGYPILPGFDQPELMFQSR